MFKTGSIPLSILTVALSALSASAFDAPNLSGDEVAALEQGEAIISVWKDLEHDRKPTASRGGIDIDSSAEHIFEILQDCDRMQEVSSDIRLCEVLETSADGSWDIRKQKFAVSPVLPKFKATFKTFYSDGPNGGHVMNIERISGDLKVQDCRWDIIALGPNKSRVVYQASLKPKLPIPGKVMRKQVAIGIPAILENLRNVAEADNAEMPLIAAMPVESDM